MVDDPRYRTKAWLDTHIRDAQLTDDEGNAVTWITQYADPPHYGLRRLFYGAKDVDLVYAIGQPTSTPLRNSDGTIYKYRETVPIRIYTVKKAYISPNKLLWTAEAELRYVAETFSAGSYRTVARTQPLTQLVANRWMLYGMEYALTYERDTT